MNNPATAMPPPPPGAPAAMPPPPPGAPAPAVAAARSFAITSGRIEGAQRIVIYGPGGIGKSTLASLAPGSVILDIEEGTREINASRIEGIETFEDLRACLRSDALDGCGTVVIDSATKAEEMALAHALKTVTHEKGNHVDNIEGYGFGKGYIHVYDTFLLLLQELDAQIRKGRNVILVAHECVETVPNPLGEDWIRYEPHLQSPKSGKASIRHRVKNWADHVLFVGYDVVADEGKGRGGGTRTIYPAELPTHIAKSRVLPPSPLPFAGANDDSVWRLMFGGAQ